MPLTVLNVAYPLAPVSGRTAGGAEQVLLSLDRHLVQSGHRSLVLATAGSRVHGLLLPVPSPWVNLTEESKREARVKFRTALDHALQKFSIDVVHLHGIDFAEYLPDAGLPMVVTLHLPLSWYRAQDLQHPPANVSFACVSRSQALTAPPGMRVAEIIPNGVDLTQFHPTTRKADYVLYLGRICPEKGLHLALDAAKQSEERLLIAGTVFDYPEHRKYFDESVRPRLGGNAVFLGAVGGRRKASLLAGAKCLLIASLARETSSLVAMEALASGTPVVAWQSGALPEIVAHGKSGFLVSSVDEMSRSIRQVPDLRPDDCRRAAERQFSAGRMVDSYLTLYEELASGARVPELQAA